MKQINIFRQRLALFFKRTKALNAKRKKNPDWSRIDAPDTFLQPFVLLMFVLFISVFAGMANYAFAEPGSLEYDIARFLVPFIEPGQSFYQVYAVFTFAVLVLVELVVYSLMAVMGEPDHHDIIGMITDLDCNTQDRIAELERTVDDRMRVLETDMVITSPEAPEAGPQ